MERKPNKNPGEKVSLGSQHQRLGERALRSLEAGFKADGWKVSLQSSRGSVRSDMVCKKGGEVYAIEVRAWAGRVRRANLQALFADAILQVRNYAAHLGARPMAVIAASSISGGIAQELKAYAQKFGDGIAWGVIDERGRFDLYGPELASVQPVKQSQLFVSEPEYREHAESEVCNPFSDLGQWMLKVLSAPNIPERWLSAPRQPIAGVADLAQSAGVSVASASRFLAGLEQNGHIIKVDGVIRLARMKALMDAWRAASQRPLKERFARFIIPSGNPGQRLRAMLAERVRRSNELLFQNPYVSYGAQAGPDGKRACLALFSACESLKVNFVRGAPIHLYSENLSPAFLNELELQPVKHRAESDLIVRKPRFPESVFRACVPVDGAPVADLLQCWLDLSLHPVRGAEQAAEIEKQLGVSEWGQ